MNSLRNETSLYRPGHRTLQLLPTLSPTSFTFTAPNHARLQIAYNSPRLPAPSRPFFNLRAAPFLKTIPTISNSIYQTILGLHTSSE
jgi:hypothetical protein